MSLSVILITKNEAHNLPRALKSVLFADELVVVDSGSSDGTRSVAMEFGARVLETHEWPGYGPQKNIALGMATCDWVLSLDADEWLSPSLANEIQKVVENNQSFIEAAARKKAYWIRRQSFYIDRKIKWGDWRNDRVLRLFRRTAYRFSEDRIHERLIPFGENVLNHRGQESLLENPLMHHPVRSVHDSISKMWAYNKVAAERIACRSRGGLFPACAHSVFTLVRGYFLRLGFFDGLRGAQLAWYNARGTYIRYRIAGEILQTERWRNGQLSLWDRLADWLNLLLTDHGILRVIYSNRWRLQGAVYRSNQPSPWTISKNARSLHLRTIVNLRGRNEQLGWYRLEQKACQEAGLKLIDIQIFSRGLIEREEFFKLAHEIKSIQTPALIHCKSGADRAGFFSTLYRHLRLGEPIETAIAELHWRFGHFRGAKTGILDHFFYTYLAERKERESLIDWVARSYSKERVESSFASTGTASWLVDRILRRE